MFFGDFLGEIRVFVISKAAEASFGHNFFEQNDFFQFFFGGKSDHRKLLAMSKLAEAIFVTISVGSFERQNFSKETDFFQNFARENDNRPIFLGTEFVEREWQFSDFFEIFCVWKDQTIGSSLQCRKRQRLTSLPFLLHLNYFAHHLLYIRHKCVTNSCHN